MPTYEYECVECSERKDVFHNMSESPVETCDECGATMVRRMSGGGGLILRGVGFHHVDYKLAPEARKKRRQKERTRTKNIGKLLSTQEE